MSAFMLGVGSMGFHRVLASVHIRIWPWTWLKERQRELMRFMGVGEATQALTPVMGG